MKLWQGVEGHQRKHVMLDVVVHVPVQKPVNWVHIYRAAVQPVVEDVLGKAGVLGISVDNHQPGSEEICKPDEHERENAAAI